MTVHVPSTSDVSTTLMNTHPCRFRRDAARTNITHDTDHKEDFEYLNEIHHNQTESPTTKGWTYPLSSDNILPTFRHNLLHSITFFLEKTSIYNGAKQ